MTAEQLAKRIEEMPIGAFAFWLGLTEDHWQEVAAARKMLATAMSVRQQLHDAALNEYRAAIIEECARVAEHLNGWGNKATQQSGLADHIAKVIRGLKDKP